MPNSIFDFVKSANAVSNKVESSSVYRIFVQTFFLVTMVLPGIAIVGYILYESVTFEINTKGFTKAKISYVEANEADSSGKSVIYNLIDADGKETSINYKEVSSSANTSEGEVSLYDSESGVSVFDERRVRFDPKNPTKLYFENSWFGKAVVIVFGSMFIFIGYVSIFQLNIVKKPKRLIIAFIASSILIIGIGLFTDFIVSLDKDNEERFKYEYLATIFIVIGASLFGYWLWLQKMWREIETIGNSIVIEQFTVNVNKRISAWYSVDNEVEGAIVEVTNKATGMPMKVEVHKDATDWACINPYTIHCIYYDENKKLHSFITDRIWFNPTPFIKGEIKVLVHPKNSKFYKIDTSFLPDVEINIGRIYTRL